MNTTQDHLLISDIQEDILLLKNGGGALVLQVSAVNFGLLSDREQIAIISSFAQMLNSLSFSIQILVYSERLNISSYLNLLDKAKQTQTNPLLSNMILSYRQFIQTTIKDNDVLDKKFFVIIPLYSLELGITASKENLEQKIKTVLFPRRDQIIRQLNRVGLKATQLTKQKLIETFYDIYNGQFVQNIAAGPKQPVSPPPPTPVPASTGQTSTSPASMTQTPPIQQTQAAKNHPFVVEELE
ncbi:hypothetical protein HYW41_00760 [Candidatus Daviesbacteria bacterium]|nr:hypothetical protein [Candidatus Daviesbacteria bacterium]